MIWSLLVLSIISLLGTTGCDFGIGPAMPERDAPPYLRQQGYDEDTIEKVLSMQDLGEQLFAKLSAEKSDDVRFLVAQNSHLPKPVHQRLIRDSNDLVRGGAALSPHLTKEQIAVEVSKHNEPSSSNHTVLLYIARNPDVSQRTLIDLHEKHGMELVWFAFNVNCPEELIQKMKATNDRDALYWLDATRKQEAYKKQQRRQE